MTNNWLDESKEKIIKEFLETKNDKDFKWFKIQAWPWTWKTTLLSHLVAKIIEADWIKSFYILSHTNSSIDTINNKIKSKWYNCDIKTIASFFIESFLMPFSYSILEKLKINSSVFLNAQYINFLEKINNNFSEKQIISKDDWNTFNSIISTHLNDEFYFNLFYNLLLSQWLKYIFIDEYQDTDLNFIWIFNKMIDKWVIKFIIVGDRYQDLSYLQPTQVKQPFWNSLDSKELNYTYRFWNRILEKVNFIRDSWITESNWKECNIIQLNSENLDWTFINDNKELFENKRNVIIFQPTTDEKKGNTENFWKDFNNDIKCFFDDLWLEFLYTEKPLYNFHLKSFFENTIKFILWNEKIIYSKDIENKIENFYFNTNESNKILFNNLIYLNNDIKLSFLMNILKECFDISKFKDENIKNYFYEILENLSSIELNLKDIEEIDIVSIIWQLDSEKIRFTTNTITSSKWKEYDNVIILDKWNRETMTNALNSQDSNALNHYYVAVSRAKENVFTFVNY